MKLATQDKTVWDLHKAGFSPGQISVHAKIPEDAVIASLRRINALVVQDAIGSSPPEEAALLEAFTCLASVYSEMGERLKKLAVLLDIRTDANADLSNVPQHVRENYILVKRHKFKQSDGN